MDFVLQLIAYPRGGSIDAEPSTGGYARGEVVNVYPSDKSASPNPNGRVCHVRVNGSPLEFNVVKSALTEKWAPWETLNNKGVWIADVPGFLNEYPEKYAELQATKETTLTWNDAENYMINKRTGNTMGEEVSAGTFS